MSAKVRRNLDALMPVACKRSVNDNSSYWYLGFLDFWIFGFLDFWIFGFLDFWTFGFLDFWTFGFLDFWNCVFSRKRREVTLLLSQLFQIAIYCNYDNNNNNEVQEPEILTCGGEKYTDQTLWAVRVISTYVSFHF
ncbi:hypothetical protein Glove_564g53 [Diversispora epigaea]|uniref:Uncharacterized protein n=1 Tax=Diversispora epigaea TaxID=1348612 RepID=A0A397GIT3_9GLOM|nr:hypothetical protein Glove_564g53 [Diversispora epigaea]